MQRSPHAVILANIIVLLKFASQICPHRSPHHRYLSMPYNCRPYALCDRTNERGYMLDGIEPAYRVILGDY